MTGEPGNRRTGLPGVSSTEVLFAVDADQRIVAWNSEAARMFGYPASQAIGWRCYGIVAGQDEAGERFCRRECDVLRAAAAGQASPTMRLTIRAQDRRRHPVDVSTILVASNGSPGPIIHLCRSPGAAPAPRQRRQSGELTGREREVLQALCNGASTGMIARQLGVSTTTVRNHVQHLLAKLPAHSRAEAVALAYRRGLMTDPDH